MITLKFFGKVPNINHSKGFARGRVFLTKETRSFKDAIFYLSVPHRGKVPSDITKFYCEVEYIFGKPNILKKNGTINLKKGDADGQIKVLQDSIFDGLGINDALIMGSVVSHKYYPEEVTVVKINFKPIDIQNFTYNFEGV